MPRDSEVVYQSMNELSFALFALPVYEIDMVRTMTRTVYSTKPTKKRDILNGVLSGFASLLIISTPNRASMRGKVKSVSQTLGDDFARIGMDMKKAVVEVTKREKTTR